MDQRATKKLFHRFAINDDLKLVFMRLYAVLLVSATGSVGL